MHESNDSKSSTSGDNQVCYETQQTQRLAALSNRFFGEDQQQSSNGNTETLQNLASYDILSRVHYQDAADAHFQAARACQRAGDDSGALQNYNLSLEAFERCSDNRIETAEIRHNIGALLLRAGGNASGALTHFLDAIRIRKEDFGDEQSIDLARAHNSAGTAYLCLSQTEAALGHFRAACDIASAYFGDQNSVPFADAQNNIGLVHWQRGNLDAALHHYQAALSVPCAVAASSVAQTHHNIGIVYRQQARFDDALKHFAKAVRAFRKDLPRTANAVSAVYNSIAIVHAERAQLDDAWHALQDAQSVSSAQAALTQTYNNMAYVHVKRGQYQDAESLLMKCIALKSECLGDGAQADDFDIACNLTNLARVYALIGETRRAQEHALRAIMALTRRYQCEEHLALAEPYVVFAQACVRAGETSHALEHLQRATKIYQNHFNSEYHYAMGDVYEVMAAALVQQQQHQQEDAADLDAAALMAEKACTVRKIYCGANSFASIDALACLGVVHARRGDTVAARECFGTAVALACAHYGEGHANTQALRALAAGNGYGDA